MGRSPLHLAVVLVAAIGSSAHAQPDRPAPRIAVVPGIAVNVDTARVDALSQDLAEALTAELEVSAVGGLDVRRLLPADGVPPDCVATPACISDVARRTGASQLLFVVMVDTGASGAIQIDTTWVDPATNQTVARPAIDLTTPSEARAKFSSVARQLLPDATARNKATDLRVITPTPAMTPRHFSTTAKITAAVGGVGLGLGVTFGLITRSKYNACDRGAATCTDSKRDSIRTFGIVADASFVIGIAGAIATGVLWATSGEEAHVVVAPTSDGAAVTAVGRF